MSHLIFNDETQKYNITSLQDVLDTVLETVEYDNIQQTIDFAKMMFKSQSDYFEIRYNTDAQILKIIRIKRVSKKNF